MRAPTGRIPPGISLGILYLISGGLGLAYEVLWSRLLAYQFGASIFGVAATVAAFMLGLGAGALFAGSPRYFGGHGLVSSPGKALRAFAALEALIALYALSLPHIQPLLAGLLDPLCAHLPLPVWHLVQGATSFVLLTIPATAMGAGFPLILRAAGSQPALLSRFYGLNCLGAAMGALGVVLLMSSQGWDFALGACATTGLVLADAAWVISRRLAPDQPEAAEPTDEPLGAPLAHPALKRYAWAYAGVGLFALMLEMAWTRLYGLIMLRTEYILAVILAVYLLGTALGSLVAPKIAAHKLKNYLIWLGGGGALLSAALSPLVSRLLQSTSPNSLSQALLLDGAVLAILLMPCTLALGAWLPLMAREPGLLTQRRTGAVLYGSNALGAAAGAVFTAAWGLPLLGTFGCICLAGAALLGLGVALFANPASKAKQLRLALALGVLGFAIWHRMPPAQYFLAAGPDTGHEIDRYEDALTLNQVMQQADGQLVLLTDLQHMDASSDPASVQIQADQLRLPLLLHGHAKRVLLLGLGTGISASAAQAWPETQLEAVEISPGAIKAAQTWFAPVNGQIMQRLHAYNDDARHFLNASHTRYDVIVGDLFHPDLAGMSSLLSVEQFARAKAHLADQGVFVQWLALNQFDVDSFNTVQRSFKAVFANGSLFIDGMHVALVGTLATQPAWASNVIATTSDPLLAGSRTGGEGAMTWLGRYLGPVQGDAGPTETEFTPRIEFRLARLHYAAAPQIGQILAQLRRQRATAQAAGEQLQLSAEQHNAFFNAYVGTDLAMQSWEAVMAGQSDRAQNLMHLSYEANPADHWMASALADERYEQLQGSGQLADKSALQTVLNVFPDHIEALRALWHWDQLQGHTEAAKHDLGQLKRLTPLDLEIARAQTDR